MAGCTQEMSFVPRATMTNSGSWSSSLARLTWSKPQSRRLEPQQRKVGVQPLCSRNVVIGSCESRVSESPSTSTRLPSPGEPELGSPRHTGASQASHGGSFGQALSALSGGKVGCGDGVLSGEASNGLGVVRVGAVGEGDPWATTGPPGGCSTNKPTVAAATSTTASAVSQRRGFHRWALPGLRGGTARVSQIAPALRRRALVLDVQM